MDIDPTLVSACKCLLASFLFIVTCLFSVWIIS
jgi:hypothetical protein